jgi:ankyrin repeat protein
LTAGDPGEEGRRRVNVALGRLCYRGEVEAVSMLLAAGASPQDDVSIVLSDHRIVFDLSLKGGAPLHSAGGRGHVAVVSLLLSAGAFVAAQDRDVSSLSFFFPPTLPPSSAKMDSPSLRLRQRSLGSGQDPVGSWSSS